MDLSGQGKNFLRDKKLLRSSNLILNITKTTFWYNPYVAVSSITSSHIIQKLSNDITTLVIGSHDDDFSIFSATDANTYKV